MPHKVILLFNTPVAGWSETYWHTSADRAQVLEAATLLAKVRMAMAGRGVTLPAFKLYDLDFDGLGLLREVFLDLERPGLEPPTVPIMDSPWNAVLSDLYADQARRSFPIRGVQDDSIKFSPTTGRWTGRDEFIALSAFWRGRLSDPSGGWAIRSLSPLSADASPRALVAVAIPPDGGAYVTFEPGFAVGDIVTIRRAQGSNVKRVNGTYALTAGPLPGTFRIAARYRSGETLTYTGGGLGYERTTRYSRIRQVQIRHPVKRNCGRPFFRASWAPTTQVEVPGHPCGVVFDYLRTAYQTTMRLWIDDREPVPVRWFQAARLAFSFNEWTVFGSRLWEFEGKPYYRSPLPHVGEQAYGGGYDGGSNKLGYAGVDTCNPAALTAGGRPGVDPPILTLEDGYSTCCGPVPVRAVGGLLIGGGARFPRKKVKVFVETVLPAFWTYTGRAGDFQLPAPAGVPFQLRAPATGSYAYSLDFYFTVLRSALGESEILVSLTGAAGTPLIDLSERVAWDMDPGDANLASRTISYRGVLVATEGDIIQPRVSFASLDAGGQLTLGEGTFNVTRFVLELLDAGPITPAVPTDFALALVGGNVLVTWDMPANALLVDVERAASAASLWSIIGRTAGAGLLDNDVTPGDHWCYRARGLSGDVYGPYSAILCVDISPPTGDRLLLESGDRLLLESGDSILLE